MTEDTESIVIDGYDLAAEGERLAFPDREVCGRVLNRGTAVVSPRDAAAPDDDASHPTAGMFVGSASGTFLDLHQGAARRLLDERHPLLEQTLAQLMHHGLAFRHDADAFTTPIDGLHTAADLTALVESLTAERFPGAGDYSAFLVEGGDEAGEVALKIAQRHAHRRFVERHGDDVFARLMDDLGIPLEPGFALDDDEPDALYADYPFVTIGCHGAFHGRTLGLLNLTLSTKAERLGFSTGRWFRHVPFNGSADDLAGLLDTRPITEILDAPGGVADVLASGHVPVDLAALFVVEPYQRVGCRFASRDWLRAIASTCEEHGILLGVDEVESFGRTGRLFAVEHYGVAPDVLWTSKASVCGITLARSACAAGGHPGRPGGRRLLDVNLAYATVDALVNHRDPLFLGKSTLENSALKGTYMRTRLADLSARHSEVFPEFSGLGGMWGLTVGAREEVVETAREMGLKLVGCGPSGEYARLRLMLLADVLTREIDAAIAVLDRVFTVMEERHPDLF